MTVSLLIIRVRIRSFVLRLDGSEASSRNTTRGKVRAIRYLSTSDPGAMFRYSGPRVLWTPSRRHQESRIVTSWSRAPEFQLRLYPFLTCRAACWLPHAHMESRTSLSIY